MNPRKDYRIKYDPDGSVARKIVYYYAEDVRADDASSGTPLRRQVSYEANSS